MNTLLILTLLALNVVFIGYTLRLRHQNRPKVNPKTHTYVQRLRGLTNLGRAITASLDIDVVLQQVLDEVSELVDAEGVAILLLENPDELVFAAVSGPGAEGLQAYRMPATEGVAGHVLRTGEAMLAQGEGDRPKMYHKVEQTSQYTTHSLLAVPLELEGKIIGVLEAAHSRPGAFSSADLHTLVDAATWVSVAIKNAQLYEQAQQEIIERRQTEAELRKVEKELQEERDFALQVMNAMGQGLVVQNIEGRFEFVNAATGHLTQREPQEMLGRSPLHFIVQEEHGRLREQWKCIQAGETTSDEYHIKRADGQTVPVLITGTPHRQRGRVVGSIAVITNLTAQKQAEDALRRSEHELERRVAERTRELEEANKRLQELDSLKSKLIDDISHEMRTPVATIKLYLDLMEKQKGHPEKQEYYRTVLQKQNQRLMQIINAILDFSNLEKELEVAPFGWIDINRIVERIAERQKPAAEEAALSLTCNLDETLPLVWGIEPHLEKALQNLVINAIRYTPEGSVKLVTYRDDEKGQVVCAVTDSGIGISEEELPYVRDKFYRGRQIGQLKLPGIGLGLAFVDEVVRYHAGELQVESQIDVGTTFRLGLPLSRNQASAIGTA